MTKKFLILITGVLALLLTGCALHKTTEELTLADIACDKGLSEESIIYIKEKDSYVPYYVLTENYNNSNCALLLRKFLLEDKISFNSSEIPAARYENCVVDNFLENEFIQVFDEEFKEKLQSVEIATIKTDNLGKANPETTLIKRQIFLLSYTEIGMEENPLEAVEGKKISAFKDSTSRIAYDSSGMAGSWWTRTAHNWGGDLAVGIGPDGSAGPGATSSLNGVRPAFCLPSDMKIVKSQDVIDNKTVYILEEVEN